MFHLAADMKQMMDTLYIELNGRSQFFGETEGGRGIKDERDLVEPQLKVRF